MNISRTTSITVLLVTTLFAGIASAAEKKALFDGKTLDGWKILKCEAEVKDGCILITEGNGLIQTEGQYGDFILEFDWKKLAEQKWDSGVYFRYDTVPPNKPWPPKHQVNLRFGMEGNCSSLKNAKSTGLVKPEEWNSFKLTVKGTMAELEINGKPAWKADGLSGPKKGYIALQAEVPNGGKHLFRNINITETAGDKTVSLFNGKDLTGWHVDVPAKDKKKDLPDSFIVRDGKLVSLGKPNGHIITDAEYANYRLEVEYRFAAKPGNCGVLVHASTPRALYGMFPKSLEVQMQHKNAGDFWCIHEDISVPDMVERRGPKEKWGVSKGKSRRIKNLTDDSEKPAGEWNRMVIECLKDEVKVWVNGDMVNHGSKCTVDKGQIALQAEGSEVEFRKLELTPITKLSADK